MKAREFRNRLLVALYSEAARSDLGGFIQPAPVADAAGLVRVTGQLRLAVKALEADGLIRLDQTLGGGDEGGMHIRLTDYGVERAQELEEALEPLAESAAQPMEYAQAAPVREAVGDALSTLQDSVRGSNSATEEERTIALAEIAVFEAAIAQPVVSLDLIDRFVSKILKWIMARFAESVTQAVVAALILRLAPFLNA